MPIGDLDVPVIGKNVVIAILVQSHILFATFILGAALITPTAEYLGMVTKQAKYERFARNLARLIGNGVRRRPPKEGVNPRGDSVRPVQKLAT